MSDATIENLIPITEIIQEIDGGFAEVCASVEAEYDLREGTVTIALHAFTRMTTLGAELECIREPWLPADERVTESLLREDAQDFVKVSFRKWVAKVRRAIPRNLCMGLIARAR